MMTITAYLDMIINALSITKDVLTSEAEDNDDTTKVLWFLLGWGKTLRLQSPNQEKE